MGAAGTTQVRQDALKITTRCVIDNRPPNAISARSGLSRFSTSLSPTHIPTSPCSCTSATPSCSTSPLVVRVLQHTCTVDIQRRHLDLRPAVHACAHVSATPCASRGRGQRCGGRQQGWRRGRGIAEPPPQSCPRPERLFQPQSIPHVMLPLLRPHPPQRHVLQCPLPPLRRFPRSSPSRLLSFIQPVLLPRPTLRSRKMSVTGIVCSSTTGSH